MGRVTHRANVGCGYNLTLKTVSYDENMLAHTVRKKGRNPS